MAYKARRKLLRAIGAIGFWGGAIFLLLDVTTPFPTPVRGAYATWWLLVVAAGAVLWVLSRRLPTLELIDLAEQHNGQLTIPTVMQDLSLPTSMAIAALEGVVGDELASETQIDKQRVWTFHGIEISTPTQSPPITPVGRANANNN
jgi:hypothetical protein